MIIYHSYSTSIKYDLNFKIMHNKTKQLVYNNVPDFVKNVDNNNYILTPSINKLSTQ